MINKKTVFPAVILSLTLAAWCIFERTAQTQVPQSNSPSVSPNVTPLSPPAESVVKLVNANVSGEVIKAYISASTVPFNLTTENLKDLRKRGISESIISSMVNHDKQALHRQHPPPAQPTVTNYNTVDPETVLPR